LFHRGRAGEAQKTGHNRKAGRFARLIRQEQENRQRPDITEETVFCGVKKGVFGKNRLYFSC